MPMKKRSSSNTANEPAKAESPLAAANSSRVSTNTCLRPTRSAIIPNTMAPTAMPIELTAPNQPICVADSAQSAWSAARMNDSSPTSMASNIQPKPESASKRLREIGVCVSAAEVGAFISDIFQKIRCKNSAIQLEGRLANSRLSVCKQAVNLLFCCSNNMQALKYHQLLVSVHDFDHSTVRHINPLKPTKTP